MSEKRWDKHVAVIGAGPVGCTLAAVLARRGFAVELFEKRADMRRYIRADRIERAESVRRIRAGGYGGRRRADASRGDPEDPYTPAAGGTK